ncbi:MAG TPA: response regulator [Thermoanaerobaculia bacterium]|nr:response regulator [Thermoanaerobaculia bacterium]
MTTRLPSSGSVLIIDADHAIGSMIASLLARAGFDTRVVRDIEAAVPLLESVRFDVIVRDLNLAPAARSQSLQQLEATAPELLRRTIIATTARNSALQSSATTTVFAILGKPFNVDELVTLVTACANNSPNEGAEPRGRGSLELETLQRFVPPRPLCAACSRCPRNRSASSSCAPRCAAARSRFPRRCRRRRRSSRTARARPRSAPCPRLLPTLPSARRPGA